MLLAISSVYVNVSMLSCLNTDVDAMVTSQLDAVTNYQCKCADATMTYQCECADTTMTYQCECADAIIIYQYECADAVITYHCESCVDHLPV